MNIKDQIRAGIMRRIKFLYKEGIIVNTDSIDEDEIILSFIDSLPEQPVGGLYEEVNRYYSDNFAYLTSDQPTLSIIANIARHFAEWQYQKDRGEFAKLKAKEWSDGYNEGIEKGKDKMLEEAVEFECIGKKVKMTIQELINYYIDQECCDVADECGF